MIPSMFDTAFDPWSALARYRERYDIEHRLGVLHHLEKTISRRRAKLSSLRRRAMWLTDELAEAKRLIGLAEDEVSRSLQTGGLLIVELLDEIREEVGEVWSPMPILGFREWSIEGGSLKGVKVTWPKPALSAQCLRDIDAEDVPHSAGVCGSPPCGIYARSSLDGFRGRLDGSLYEDSAVGVIALSGKVVEHEAGYRAQHARAVAVVAQTGGRHLTASKRSIIELLFADPGRALTEYGATGELDQAEAESFLRDRKERYEQWT